MGSQGNAGLATPAAWMKLALAIPLTALAAGAASLAAPQSPPWLDATRSADERASLAVGAMTLDEKISLLHGQIALPWTSRGGVRLDIPAGAIPGAGYVPGIPRLGIPALYETDAGLGVANPDAIRVNDVATALPASLLLAATFDPSLSRRAGALVGREARAKGFNVLLGGGVNLARDPRNGRNFEYFGEDPLLAGTLAAAAVDGTQSAQVICTVKHFVLNANETNRTTLDARIAPAALRESDLLAFEIAIERGHPGAVMCAYNLVNGEHSCGSRWLLGKVLKGDWGYPGWVMSDWGAVHGVEDAASGLDQESGEQLDPVAFFGAPLKAALLDGRIPVARVDDMVHRILRSMFAVGVVDRAAAPDPGPAPAGADYAEHGLLAREIAQKGIVLLKNDGGLLPLAPDTRSIAVIGGHANVGVLSGGGSSQVIPSNGAFIRLPLGGAVLNWRDALLDPSAPLEALQRALPQAQVRFDGGAFPARAAALAATSEIAIVFVTRHEMEGDDIPDLALPDGQDVLIAAVAHANPRTIVILEAGNPVSMPWLDQVSAVLMAWYPGQEGGRAIADVLSGATDPSGRLPITFPRDAADFLRPNLPNLGSTGGEPVRIDYSEGADVGYRWYNANGVTPRFAFGFGLSYTQFEYRDLVVSGGKTLTVSFDVRNTGARAGADVPQAYLTAAAGARVCRLIGFQRVELEAGAVRRVRFRVDPRLLGGFDARGGRWRIKSGIYAVRVARSAIDRGLEGEAGINAARGEGRAWQSIPP